MRIVLTILVFMGCLFAKGQSHMPIQSSISGQSSSAVRPSSSIQPSPTHPAVPGYSPSGLLLFSPYVFAGSPLEFLSMPYSIAGVANTGQKWQLRPFATLSAGYTFLTANGYNSGVSYFSVPLGAMLLHPLNKNLTAFGAVSATPVIFSANQFINSGSYPAYPGGVFSRPYNAGLNARVEGGLIYTNDDKTFSISGSIGVERGSYPVYYAGRPATKNQ